MSDDNDGTPTGIRAWTPKQYAYWVLDKIESHPESWNQRSWVTKGNNECQTAYCFAGYLIHLVDPGAVPVALDGYSTYPTFLPSGGGPAQLYEDAAIELLGLVELDEDDDRYDESMGIEHECSLLFEAGLTLPELKTNVERIFGPREDGT